MKVKDLIKKLKKMDPEMDVLCSDHDEVFYDIGDIRTLRVEYGNEVLDEKLGEEVVGLIAW